MNVIPQTSRVPDAWVVFSGQCELPWLRLLRPGFRHCYLILKDGEHWLSFDPLSTYTDICVHDHVPAEFNLPEWLSGRGYTVLKTPLERSRKIAPWLPHTCVEAVKRVIGLRSLFILTPWQLYRHLTKHTTSKGEVSWQV